MTGAVIALVLFNFGQGIWTTVYLTMAQEVSSTHVSTAVGILSGCGSLAGALAMWAVGRVTKETGSFSIPMVAVALAAALAGMAGWIASKNIEPAKEVAA
jgi:cyanate permease